MKKILGTGLSGLVGSRVVELLSKYSFEDASIDTGVDILNYDSLENFFENNPDSDTVLHMAAFTDTSVAWNEINDKNGICWRVNVVGTENILKLCNEYSKHLIYISTDYVFNGNKAGTYEETDTPEPLDWYGQTKYEAEKMILNSGLSASIVRISYPYRAKFDKKIDLVRKILEKLQKGENVKLFHDQITTPTFIDDIVYGLDKVIEKKPSGIFHLVASSFQSVYEMGLGIAKVFDLDSSLVTASSLKEYLKNPDARPYAINGAISNTKTKSILGIETSEYLDGLKKMKLQM